MTDLSDVLAEVDSWPVDSVGVGVTTGKETIATYGAVDVVLPLASVTKPLTAYAVLIAVQDGAVHLDEPAGPPDAPDGITVRNLLAHASGLPFESDGPVGTVERRRIYSNWAYDLLGDLVAQRVGSSFEEQVRWAVCAPLGMTDTIVDGAPSAGGRGTVTDLLAFARELLDPQLLDPDLHTAATTVAYPGLDGVVPGYGRQSPCDWGLGFEIAGAKRPHWTGSTHAPSTFGHFGGSGSFLWVDPTRGLACAELADRRFGTWAKERWEPFNDRIVAACEAAS